ncbi:MAG: hypothetical protein OHK0028_01780 [Deltaproteobacteria bacterium]
MILLAFTEKHLQAVIFMPMLYGAIALFAAGNILLYVGIRCPKCDAMIGYAIVFSAGKTDRCPRCKGNFDENADGGRRNHGK